MVLHSNRDAVWAEEVIRDRGSSLTPESLYRLTMLATGDVNAAEKAQAERFLDIERKRHAGQA